jgi:hypothetical protein
MVVPEHEPCMQRVGNSTTSRTNGKGSCEVLRVSGQNGTEKQIVVTVWRIHSLSSARERDYRDPFMIGGDMDAFFAARPTRPALSLSPGWHVPPILATKAWSVGPLCVL